MENKPFYYPPKYAFECMNKNRKNLFKHKYPEHNCVMDPYYHERTEIFNDIADEFDQNKDFNIDEKVAWRNAMQNVYRKKNIKTPYNFYNHFITGITEILENTSNKSKIPILLYSFINKTYKQYFVPDPFYSFFSMLDFSLFELFRGKHESDNHNNHSNYQLNISDENLVEFIKLLIDNGYIGLTQLRFLLYFSILYRYTIFDNLVVLIYNLKTPLRQIIGDKMIDLKMYHRLLLQDSLEFAYTQWKFDMVEYIIETLRVPFESINPKIIKSLSTNHKLKGNYNNLSEKYKLIVDKYYS
jgi:hypothetical protein